MITLQPQVFHGLGFGVLDPPGRRPSVQDAVKGRPSAWVVPGVRRGLGGVELDAAPAEQCLELSPSVVFVTVDSLPPVDVGITADIYVPPNFWTLRKSSLRESRFSAHSSSSAQRFGRWMEMTVQFLPFLLASGWPRVTHARRLPPPLARTEGPHLEARKMAVSPHSEEKVSHGAALLPAASTQACSSPWGPGEQEFLGSDNVPVTGRPGEVHSGPNSVRTGSPEVPRDKAKGSSLSGEAPSPRGVGHPLAAVGVRPWLRVGSPFRAHRARWTSRGWAKTREGGLKGEAGGNPVAQGGGPTVHGAQSPFDPSRVFRSGRLPWRVRVGRHGPKHAFARTRLSHLSIGRLVPVRIRHRDAVSHRARLPANHVGFSSDLGFTTFLRFSLLGADFLLRVGSCLLCILLCPLLVLLSLRCCAFGN